MTLIELTDKKLEETEKALKHVEARLRNAPKGALYIRNEKGKLRYYNRDQETGTVTYLDEKHKAEILSLEEKNYYRKLKISLTEETGNLKRIRRILENTPDWKKVYYDIPEEKRHMIAPLDISGQKLSRKEIDAWNCAISTYKKKNRNPTAYVTLNGENVKSKSELIIADRLKAAGVPYHYEPRQGIADEHVGDIMVWSPDFKALNVRTGKEYFWEHFGKMDDPDYFSTCQFKLSLFADNGIYMGENLIVTMESSRTPLNTGYVDRLIERFLI